MKSLAKTPLKIWSQAMFVFFFMLLSGYFVIWLTDQEMPTFWAVLAKFKLGVFGAPILFLIREYYVRNRIIRMEEKGKGTEKTVLEKEKAETEFLAGYGIFMAIFIIVGGLAITILFLIAHFL